MSGYGTADAETREAAWLSDPTSGLLVADNGPFDVVQAFWPRQPGKYRGVYVMTNPRVQVIRENGLESYARYPMRVRVRWPLTFPGGLAETDQLNFRGALDLLIGRIVGPQIDKTHGGQFMSVAVGVLGATPVIDVQIDPQEQMIAAGLPLTATVTYTADDPEQFL